MPCARKKQRECGRSGRRFAEAPDPSERPVPGLTEATVTLTEHASRHGLGAVLSEEIGISVSGRGEWIRADPPSPSLLIPVANIPSYVGRAWKTA
jgi:hypothetical protein